MKVTILDGYIDEPACLGVPPFISPQVRAAAGAAISAGAEVEYITIDKIRKNNAELNSDVTLFMSGNAVPGKYLRAMPASKKRGAGNKLSYSWSINNRRTCSIGFRNVFFF